MLPGEGGLSLCQKLRAQTDIAIVMLTAMGELSDRIIGLELGADDYLTKPFDPRELLARLRAVQRRAGEKARGGSRRGRSSPSPIGTWISPAVNCARPRA